MQPNSTGGSQASSLMAEGNPELVSILPASCPRAGISGVHHHAEFAGAGAQTHAFVVLGNRH